jgi:hypothetical protein
MMHVERMSNTNTLNIKYEHLKSWLVYLSVNDLTHVVHISMVYNEENEFNGTALLPDFLWMACSFFHDHAYALIL